MRFSGGINRPPYETADGYLQTTEGCSHNHCLFCTYFKDQKLRKASIEEIEEDIKEIPAYFWAVHPLDSVKIEGTLRDNKQQMMDALAWEHRPCDSKSSQSSMAIYREAF